MRIALDFDGTYTAAPHFWEDFIRKAEVSGHLVWIVTARDEDNDGIDWSKVGAARAPCTVIFCDGRPKRQIVRELGIEIDIWIDDNPAGIVVKGASFAEPEGLAAWRAKDQYRGSKLPITGESRGFADRQQSTEGNASDDGRPRLFSRRDSGNSGSVPQGE